MTALSVASRRIGASGRSTAASALELTITPPRSALTGPGVTYPLYIDPAMSGGQQAWGEVTKNGWHYFNAAMDAQVGKCWNGRGECGALTVARSYFRLDTAPLLPRNGKTAVIFSADMWFTQVWGSHLCVAEPVSLYATGYFDGGMTWGNQPLGSGALPGNPMDTRSSGAGAQCSGAGGVRFNADGVKNYAKAATDNGWASVHMALASPDENNDLQWKKFATSGTAAPHFDVVFSFPPNPAGVEGVSNGVTCTGRAITPDARPALYARATDNNNPPLNVGLAYEVWNGAQNTRLATGTIEVGSGTLGGWTIPTALGNGDYAYRVAVYNVFPGDGSKNLWNGSWSPWYAFTIRATPPSAAPKIESSVDYPADYWGAANGAAGGFAVSGSGSPDIVGYTYTFNGSGTEPVPNTVSCNYTPTGSNNGGWIPRSASGVDWIPIPSGLPVGRHTLHVRSFDDAHNLSPESTGHVFYVAPNTGQSTQRFEAESLPRSQPAGQSQPLGPQGNCCNTTWSGNQQLNFGGNAAGQSFTVTMNVNGEADYQVAIGMTKANDYGQAAFTLDGQPIGQPTPGSPVGSSFDAYNRFVINAYHQLGIRHLTSGTHTFQVTVTGKNSSSLAYLAGLDFITLTRTMRYEAEEPAQVAPSQPANQNVPLGPEIQGCCNGGPWSRAAQVLFNAGAANTSFDLAFSVPFEADYALGAALSKRDNRGQLRIAIDGKPLLGTDITPWDGYLAGTARTDYLAFGGAHLAGGQHRLTFSVVGKNTASSSYTAGVDYLTAVPVNNITAASFEAAMNNRGFASDNVAGANLDFFGNSFSTQTFTAAGLAQGSKVTHARATFTVPAKNLNTGNDNIVATGQTIPLPDNQRIQATSIALLAASTCGDTPPTTGTVTYTDGTSSNPFFPGVPDWINGNEDLAALTLAHWNNGSTPGTAKPKVYAIFAPVDPTKTLASITLPNPGTSFLPDTCAPIPALHVLAIAPQAIATGWLGAWSAPIDNAYTQGNTTERTYRMIVHPTKTGQSMRLRLSNTQAAGPLTLPHVTVAPQSGTVAAATRTPVSVLFNGNANVTIPAGGEVYSDPLAFPDMTGSSGNLLISIDVPAGQPFTVNYSGNNLSFRASGNVTSNVDGMPFGDEWSSIYGNTYVVTGIEIYPSNPTEGTVAVLSDDWYSYGTRYPEWWPIFTDLMPAKLGSLLPGGIVHTGYYPAPDTMQTFYRTVLAEPNLRTVIVNMNDIYDGDSLITVRQRLTALMSASSPTGLKRFYRPDGTPVRIVLTTVPPSGLDAGDQKEQVRRQVNADILANYVNYGADSVVDFDAAVRDPAAPNQIQPSLGSSNNPDEAMEDRLAQAIADAAAGFPPLTL